MFWSDDLKPWEGRRCRSSNCRTSVFVIGIDRLKTIANHLGKESDVNMTRMQVNVILLRESCSMLSWAWLIVSDQSSHIIALFELLLHASQGLHALNYILNIILILGRNCSHIRIMKLPISIFLRILSLGCSSFDENNLLLIACWSHWRQIPLCKCHERIQRNKSWIKFNFDHCVIFSFHSHNLCKIQSGSLRANFWTSWKSPKVLHSPSFRVHKYVIIAAAKTVVGRIVKRNRERMLNLFIRNAKSEKSLFRPFMLGKIGWLAASYIGIVKEFKVAAIAGWLIP